MAMATFKIISAIFLASTLIFLFGTNPSFEVRGFQVSVGNRVKILTSPLLGGPSWLKVHCKVIVDDSYVFDFVPLNAASVETIQKLVCLQPVPATIRTIQNNASSGLNELFKKRSEDDNDDWQSDELYSRRAVEFCNDYDQDLHLIRNNCWSFAFDLIQNISHT